MKKIYILSSLLAVGTFAFAQQRISNVTPVPVQTEQIAPPPVQPQLGPDTLAGHFAGGTPVIYTSGNGGYVAGHNGYNDISKAQLFDNQYGVTGSGVINGVLLWVGGKEGNPSSTITVRIWSDNAGVPGTVIGSTTVTFAQMDTSLAGTFQIGSPFEAAYNTIAMFTTPVNIPSGNMFWAGFTMTYNPGDTMGLVTTTDPEFSNAVTHTFEQWSDNSWHSFNDGTGNTWQLDIAQGIFPVVNIGTGIAENGAVSFNLFPNPSQGTVNVNLPANTDKAVMSVYNILGEEVFSANLENALSTVSLSNLAKGSYVVTITTENGVGTQKLMID